MCRLELGLESLQLLHGVLQIGNNLAKLRHLPPKYETFAPIVAPAEVLKVPRAGNVTHVAWAHHAGEPTRVLTHNALRLLPLA